MLIKREIRLRSTFRSFVSVEGEGKDELGPSKDSAYLEHSSLWIAGEAAWVSFVALLCRKI